MLSVDNFRNVLTIRHFLRKYKDKLIPLLEERGRAIVFIRAKVKVGWFVQVIRAKVIAGPLRGV